MYTRSKPDRTEGTPTPSISGLLLPCVVVVVFIVVVVIVVVVVVVVVIVLINRT